MTRPQSEELPGTARQLNDKGNELGEEYLRTSNIEVLIESIKYRKAAVAKVQSDERSVWKAACLNNLGRGWCLLFNATGDEEHITTAVKAGRESIKAAPGDTDIKVLCAANLSENLAARYISHDAADQGDLLEALQVARDAVASPCKDSDWRASALAVLANRLGQYYEHIENDERCLDEAIEIGQELVRVPSDEKGVYALNLAAEFKNRFVRRGDVKDLVAARDHFTEAVGHFAPGHTNRLSAVRQLSDCLLDLAARTSQPSLLSEATAAMENLDLTIASSTNLAKYYHSKSLLFKAKYDATLDIDDLETALAASQEALSRVEALNAERELLLTTLGSLLALRGEVTLSKPDMAAAISHSREAVAISAAIPTRQSGAYSMLGSRLSDYYQVFGGTELLEESLAARRRAVELLPRDHNGLPTRKHNLAIGLRDHFAQLGHTEFLDESIVLEREAIEILSANDDPDVYMALDGLSHSLSRRSKQTGNSHDLEEAIIASARAVARSQPGSASRSVYLNSYANRLSDKFSQTNDREDIDKAIAAVLEAVHIKGSNAASEVIYLITLSNCLATRYKRYQIPDDLDESIRYGRQMIALCPPTHPSLSVGKHNLGLRLESKFFAATNPQDKLLYLQEALTMAEEIVASSPEEHPDMPDYLTELAKRQIYLASLMDISKEAEALAMMAVSRDTFLSAFRKTYSTPLQRIGNGNFAGVLSLGLKDYEVASTVLSDSVQLFKLASPMSLNEQDRQRQLHNLSGNSTNACASFIALNKPERGLEIMEAGRGVMANIVMGYHSDLSAVKSEDAALHASYVELRDSISRPLASISSHGSDLVSTRNAQFIELSRVEDRIRALPGLADFNSSFSAQQMKAMASEGPIVAFCCAKDQRCDALIVTTKAIEAVPLPGLVYAEIQERVKLVVSPSRLSSCDMTKIPAANKKIRHLLAWLWENATLPVLEHLDLMQHNEDEPLTRLWWVTSGLLGLLPLHAAGKGHKFPKQNVHSHVVSSYTSSFQALAFARRCHAKVDDASPKAALITMPHTPGGLNDLSTEDESLAILEAFDASNISGGFQSIVELCQPSAAQVLDRVRSSGVDIFHIACHAEPDLDDPSGTALLFGNDPSALAPDPLPVRELSRYQGASAYGGRPLRLAYLSACCTAQQYDLRLMDENIHLASAFQLSGFPSVIGTLWEADDTAAVVVAKAFYQRLFELDAAGRAEGSLSCTGNVARALHYATAVCRQRKVERGNAAEDVLAWASFVHIGA